MTDLRYALRMLVKSPGFTVIAVVTLALGIGVTTAMFSVVNQVLLQPPPYPYAGRLTHISWLSPQGYGGEALNAPQALFVSEHARTLDAVAIGFVSQGCNLSGGSRPEYVSQNIVSTNFLRTLGIVPVIGRDFPVHGTDAEPAAALISYGLWQRLFNGQQSALGQQIRCNDASYTIIGVLPRDFRYTEPGDIWMSEDIKRNLEDLGTNYLVIGRLAPYVTQAQAQQEMDVLSRQFRRQMPEAALHPQAGAQLSLYADWIREGDRRPLLILFGAVVLVLMIAGANVSSLMLARASVRSRELAIRAALGASARRVFKQLIIESMLLHLLGGVAGVLAAWWSLSLLNTVVPERFPFAGEVHMDVLVLGFALLICVLAGIFSAVAPALHFSRPNMNSFLKAGEAGAGSSSHNRTRKLLVATEVALALVLLAGSAVLIRSFVFLQRVNSGFDPRNVQVAMLSLASGRYDTTAAVVTLDRELRTRLASVPGVTNVATAAHVPLRRGLNLGLSEIFGRKCDLGWSHYHAVSPGYFETLRIPLLRGRTFSDADVSGAAPVIIVNEAFARRCFGNDDPLGTQLWYGKNSKMGWKDSPRSIIGIVGDVKERSLGIPTQPTAFVPVAQVTDTVNKYTNHIFVWSLLVRTSGPVDARGAIERAVHDVDPDQPIIAIRPATDLMRQTMDFSRLLMQLMGLFAALAIVLTAIGIYGLLSFYVARRTHEIGIRMALGAARPQVLAMVVREGLVLVMGGAVVGTAGALAATRLMKGFVYGVREADPLSFAAAALVLIGVALFATWLPARRATKVDPMVALRYE